MYVGCQIKKGVKKLQINIYKDTMQKANLFGSAVLYSKKPIPQEDVPQHWYCYELRGTTLEPDKPYALVDLAMEHYTGSILSPLPLKKETAQSRLLKGKFELTSEHICLSDFCSEYQIPQPETPVQHMPRPASPDEAGLSYALPPEKDGKMGLTEKGRQMLRDAADPSLPHQYSWYVIQDITRAGQRVGQVLPLDEAIEHYMELDSEDKRLGVAKDGIASVDLVIRKDGREWISEDYQKLDSFAQDPVVAEAVNQIRQALEEQTQGQTMTMGGMT